MSGAPAQAARPGAPRHFGEDLRVAFVGSATWLDGCAPTAAVHGLRPARFQIAHDGDRDATLAALSDFRPHATVVFDPPSMPLEALGETGGPTLGVLVSGAADGGGGISLEGLDRLVSFDPALTGTTVGGAQVWRAVPPPVSDALFDEVRPLGRRPRAISIGRSTAHREAMLLPAKHHHDLLQVIHGVSGEPLRELLGECDVGVYVAPDPGPGFGLQVGMHLAAGHLLVAGELGPAHGLERNLDYLHMDSPDGLVWILDRLGRFPSMHQRVRFRGRMKAEQYRASRLFARLTHDLLADVAAFGAGAGQGG